MYAITFVLLSIAFTVKGQYATASCKNPETMKNFNAIAYSGTWNMISSYQNEVCGTTTFTVNVSAGTINLRNTEVKKGKEVLVVENGSFKDIGSKYRVLETDHKNYSILYSCSNGLEYAWVLSRETSLSDAGTEAVNKFLASSTVISKSKLKKLDQSNKTCGSFRKS